MVKLPLIILILLAIATVGFADQMLQSEKAAAKRLRPKKLSHLRFYWHDVVSGRDPTSVPVARAAVTNSSSTGFGLVSIIDDALTVAPELSSQLVGRAEGLYVSASKETLGLLVAMSFAFTEGKYNGSTLTILGRSRVLSAVREMPIVGGSGLFRFATGYVEGRTYWLDQKTSDATIEYNVFVVHDNDDATDEYNKFISLS